MRVHDSCRKNEGDADDADLWIPLPGNGDALTEFAEQRDGRLGAGDECCLFFWTQVVVIWAKKKRKQKKEESDVIK